MENNILYDSLQKYYNNEENSKYLLKYLKYEKISLRIIDWFVTNYSKKNDTIYHLYNDNNILTLNGELNGENMIKPFNIFNSYKSQLKSYSKKLFDPFCRRNRLKFKCLDVEIFTTLGQLNFFKWAIDNLVVEYIIKNNNIIENDMNTSIQNIRKNYIKTSGRKQRQELSLSASRGLTKHNGKHIISFN